MFQDQDANSSSTQANDSNQTQDLPPVQSSDNQGKTLPKYRMGIGQRILGTLANFANGFARNGAQPVYVGPGALNNRYYQDQAAREQQNQYIAQHSNEAYWNYVDPNSVNKDVRTGQWVGKNRRGHMVVVPTPQGEEEQKNDTPTTPPINPQQPFGGAVGNAWQTPARMRLAELLRNKPYR